jgi:hypothetical protein
MRQLSAIQIHAMPRGAFSLPLNTETLLNKQTGDGDPVYGIRKAGKLPASAAGLGVSVSFVSNIGTQGRFVSCGGWIQTGVSAVHYSFPAGVDKPLKVGEALIIGGDLTIGGLFRFTSGLELENETIYLRVWSGAEIDGENNSEYDIWCEYTKQA